MSQRVKLITKRILSISDSRYQFNKFIGGLKEEFKPDGFYENFLVSKMAADYWRLKKALIYQDRLLQDGQVENLKNNALSQVVGLIKSVEKSIETGKKALKETKDKNKWGNFG